MQSIIRFLVVMGIVLGTVLIWRPEVRGGGGTPPKNMSSGVNPYEEVERSLSSLHLAPVISEWSKEAYQSRLEEAFRRHDPCTVMVLMHENAPVSPEERWAAGMEVFLKQIRSRDPVLQELFAKSVSPLLGKANEESTRPETRFFNALLLSGQLEGFDENSESPQRNSLRNFDTAINTLKELVAADPENGAYSFFLAQGLRQMGTKKEEVQAAYVQAAKASHFNTFYQTLYDTLLKSTYDNMAEFAWVYSYLHQAPMPNFANGTRNLRNWASEGDTGKWIAGKLAKRLIDTGAKYKAESPGYIYSQSEYMLGYGLRYAIAGTAEKSWEEHQKRMKEARDFISETPPAVGEAASDLYKDFFEGREQECRWASWQSLFDTYKAKLDGSAAKTKPKDKEADSEDAKAS